MTDAAIAAPAVRGAQACGRIARTGAAPDSRWYVVHTKPSCETRAAFHLERQSYRVFFPRIGKQVRHARVTRRVFEPLFPTYLFVHLDPAREPWRSINGTHGVVGLVMQGERPLPVLPGVVETIAAQAGDDGPGLMPAFRIGQDVRISDGPLRDLVGTLQQLSALGRACVLLEMLGRSIPVTLPHGALSPSA